MYVNVLNIVNVHTTPQPLYLHLKRLGGNVIFIEIELIWFLIIEFQFEVCLKVLAYGD